LELNYSNLRANTTTRQSLYLLIPRLWDNFITTNKWLYTLILIA